jgi:mannan endo-1,4-beta-mannosidase
MRKYLLLLVLLTFLSSCNSHSGNEFISVTGTQLTLKAKPYRFVGFNMWYAFYLGATSEGQKRLLKELDTLKSYGFDNLRILGGSEKSCFERSLPLTIQTSPGIYNESLLKGLDFVLAEMGKRNMYAVVYLNNYWQWSGGMAQYMNWSRHDSVTDRDNQGDFSRMMKYSAGFYADTKANEIFRNYIKMIVNRKNTFSGLQYRDDPAIMAWELANEPRPGPDGADGERNIDKYISWIHETSAWIHSIDRNHLVTTGSEGIVGAIQKEDYFMRTHNDPSIDFITFHLWAKNWGWFDAKRADSTLPLSISNAREYINHHTALARKLGKPITLEEFGLERDSAATAPFTGVKSRDIYFGTIMKIFADSSLANSPLAGVNVWAYGGFGKPASWEKVINNPESFLGDPFGEPQGLNSVYISDTSTLNILHRTGKILKSK